MQSECESGRNASNPGWHVPRISRSISHRMVVLGYISRAGVNESIHWRCLKKEILMRKVLLLIECPCWR